MVFSTEELLAGFALHQKRTVPWLRSVLVVVAVLLILVSIYVWFQDGFSEAYLFFLGGILFLSVPFITPIAFKRQMAKHPFLNQEMLFYFDVEGFQNKSVDNRFDAKQSWSMVYEAVLTEKGFLLYPQRNLFCWVPETAFATVSEFEETRSLITRHVAKCKTV